MKLLIIALITHTQQLEVNKGTLLQINVKFVHTQQ